MSDEKMKQAARAIAEIFGKVPYLLAVHPDSPHGPLKTCSGLPEKVQRLMAQAVADSFANGTSTKVIDEPLYPPDADTVTQLASPVCDCLACAQARNNDDENSNRASTLDVAMSYGFEGRTVLVEWAGHSGERCGILSIGRKHVTVIVEDDYYNGLICTAMLRAAVVDAMRLPADPASPAAARVQDEYAEEQRRACEDAERVAKQRAEDGSVED